MDGVMKIKPSGGPGFVPRKAAGGDGRPSLDRVVAALEAKGCKGRGSKWQCPAHEDRNPSLTVNHRDGQVLIHCHAGCSFDMIADALSLPREAFFDDYDPSRASGRTPVQSPRPERPRTTPSKPAPETWINPTSNAAPPFWIDDPKLGEVEKTYDYMDGERLLYQTVRFKDPKDFRQRAADGQGGWRYSMEGVDRRLYYEDEVIAAVEAADTIHVVEGEKDVESLRALDLVATTWAGGGRSFVTVEERAREILTGADVVLCRDLNPTGEKMAADVEAVIEPVARSFKRMVPTAGMDITEALETHGNVLEKAMEPEPVVARDWSDNRFAKATISFDDVEPNLANTYLVKGVFDQSALSVTYGASGSGKTFITLDIAFCVATGRVWMERRVQEGLVVYVAAEGAGSLGRRIKALRLTKATNEANVKLAVITRPADLLDREGDVDELIAWIHELERKWGEQVVLVVIDTLSQSMAGGDENGPKDMTKAVDSLRRIKEGLSAHVNVVHHTGKNEAAGSRGHSSLRAATDTELEVKHVDGIRIVTATKQRDAGIGPVAQAVLKSVVLGQDEDGDTVTSCVVESVVGTQSSRMKLTGNAGLLMECFDGLIWQREAVMLTEEHLKGYAPTKWSARAYEGAWAVSGDALKNQFSARFMDGSNKKSDSARTAFDRALKKLRSDDILDTYEDLVFAKLK